MVIVYDDEDLAETMAAARRPGLPGPPRLPRRSSLKTPSKCDVDALCDGEERYVGGVLEHIEDVPASTPATSARRCVPPFSLSAKVVAEMRERRPPAGARLPRAAAW